MGAEEFFKCNKGCIDLDEIFRRKFSSFLEKKGCDDFLDKIVSTFENPSTRQVEENKFMAIKPTYIVVRLKGHSSEEYDKTMNKINGLIDVFKQENQEYNQKNKEICVGYIV